MAVARQANVGGQQLPLFAPASDWRPPAELPSLRGARQLSIDTESRDLELLERGPGFARGDAHLVGVSLATDTGVRCYLPTRHEGGGNLDERLVQRWARAELNAFEGEVIGHSLNYDLDGLATWGVTFPRAAAFHDLAVAEPLLDEWRYEYNLDALARDYLGEGKDEDLLLQAARAYGYPTRQLAKRYLHRLPAGLVGPYAEADADRPLRVWPLQRAKLEADELTPIYEIERKLIPLLVRMRRRGLRVDLQAAKALVVRFRGEVADIVAELRRVASARVDLNQAATLGPLLEGRGITVPRTKKTDQPSVTKALLEAHKSDPVAALVLRGRQLEKVISTFLESQVLAHQHDGRLHPTFNQLKGDDGGTIARFSGEHPNTQFFPARDEELAPLVRGLLLPEEGCDWQRDDYSQIEYRLLVHFAVGEGAEAARERYRTDPKTDYHKLVGAMLGADPDDKILRKRVKNTNFAKGYGAGVTRLAETFGCSEEEAVAFIAEYDAAIPFAKETYDAAMRVAERTGVIHSVLRRKQRFLLWWPASRRDQRLPNGDWVTPLRREDAVARWGQRLARYKVHAALNRKLQSSSADITKKAMVDADAAGLLADDLLGPFLLTVHDELGSSVPRTSAGDEAGRELTRVMERAVKLRVPVLVESERGPNWGACK
jgi:DNA polymerase I-like protein with 3'-5' exonuclease and polymerase domains